MPMAKYPSFSKTDEIIRTIPMESSTIRIFFTDYASLQTAPARESKCSATRQNEFLNPIMRSTS
jgi:hypothetical protein